MAVLPDYFKSLNQWKNWNHANQLAWVYELKYVLTPDFCGRSYLKVSMPTATPLSGCFHAVQTTDGQMLSVSVQARPWQMAKRTCGWDAEANQHQYLIRTGLFNFRSSFCRWRVWLRLLAAVFGQEHPRWRFYVPCRDTQGSSIRSSCSIQTSDGRRSSSAGTFCWN